MKKTNRFVCSITIAAIFCLLAVLSPLSAAAQTDEHPLSVTDEPEKLELQLGAEWIGTEFELKTDAGTFPVPVIVGEDGFLRMELGGSQTYTLRILSAGSDREAGNVTNPPAESSLSGAALSSVPEESPLAGEITEQESQESEPESPANPNAIPPLHIILFVGGMIICIGALIAMWVLKKRRLSDEEDEEDDE